MFSVKLKELREKAGYSSQQEFAEAFGVKQSAVGNWEAGSRTPTLKTIKELSRFFHVSTDYLLDLTDDPTASGGPFAAYIRKKRGDESESSFAARCGISVDLLQKIERGLCKNHPSTISIKYTCLSDDQIKSIAKGVGLADWRYIQCLYDEVNPHNVEYPQVFPEPSKVILPQDDRTEGFPTWLPSDPSGLYLTEEEQQMIRARRKADARARDMVDLALKPFTEEATPPAQSDAAM